MSKKPKANPAGSQFPVITVSHGALPGPSAPIWHKQVGPTVTISSGMLRYLDMVKP
jgi:hypothetical protein